MATAPADPTQEIANRSSLTPHRLVIALVGVCLLVGAAVLWALFGRAPETVTGRGIILPEGGFADMSATTYVSDFLATSEGVQLTKAFIKIKSSRVRRRIVDLVEALAEEGEENA